MSLDAVPGPDVVVVGAGPAGAIAARELARRGRRVLLVDRRRLPRPKVCGGCLHPRGVRRLADLGLASVLPAVDARPLGELVIVTAGRRVRATLPLGVVVERGDFDAELARHAVQAGAELLTGAEARLHPDPPDAPWRRLGLHRDDGTQSTMRAGLVVAADGLGSALLAGECGATRPAPRSPLGAGAWLPAEALPDHALPDGRVVLAVGRQGYLGLARLPDGRIDLAAALHPAALREAGSLARATAALLADAGDDLAAEAAAGALWRSTPALNRRPRRVWSPRVLAVGDAAGFVEPFTGEGLSWAIEGGALLGERAADGWRPELGRAWQRALSARLAPSRWRCALVSRALRAPRLVASVLPRLSAAPSLVRALALHGHGR